LYHFAAHIKGTFCVIEGLWDLLKDTVDEANNLDADTLL